MSAFGGKADIVRVRDSCPLMTQSGRGEQNGVHPNWPRPVEF